MQNIISFPGLGLELSVSRIALSIGNLHVYWYGVIIAVGFLVAMLYASHACKLNGVKFDHVIDMVLCAVPAGIIGARALYVIFKYNELYYYDFWAMFRIWDGGSAIFGGLVLGILAVVIYAYFRRVRIASLMDIAGPSLLIAESIGRWGNFVNQEVYGTACTNFLRMGIYVRGEYMEVHPLFLYESLWTLAGFILLALYFKHRKYNGEIFLLSMFWYGLGRCFIEPLRENNLYFGNSNLKVNLVFAALSCIVGLGMLFYTYLFRERDPESLTQPYLPPRKRKKKNAEAEEEAPVEAPAAPAAEENNVIGGISFDSLSTEAAEKVEEAAQAAEKAPEEAVEAVKEAAEEENQ